MAKWFKKREAFSIADRTNKLNADKKASFKLSPFKFYDAYGTNVEDKDVMQKWVERKLTVRAENQIITREYLKSNFWKDLLWIALGAILVTIGYDYFISATGATGLFPFGSGAFARFFAILTYPHNDQIGLQSSFFFIYLFAINIPLMVFGYVKVGAKFTLLTILFLVLQIAFDQILQAIPVINPTDWIMMVNTQEIGAIPTSWNGTVWLFLKGLIGGVIAGIGYAMSYKGGGSSAGTDFVTMYVSIRKEKSIANVNRNVYYVILFVVIVLNTVILSPENFNPDIKYGQLYMSGSADSWNHMMSYIGNNPSQFSESWFNNGTLETSWSGLTNMSASSIADMNSALKNSNEWTLNGQTITIYQYREIIMEVSKSQYKDFTTSQINMMRFLFIFGPSLFASLLLVITSTLVTDYFYPTHKVKTYVIATNEADKMKIALDQIGYRNNFIRFNAENEFQGKVLDRDVIMITMTVTNWREVEPALLEVDSRMSVNILKTDRVKGYFDYRIRSDRANEEAYQILKKDKDWMKDIHQASLVKTDKEYVKYMAKRDKIVERNTLKVNEEAKTLRELKLWYKAQLIKINKTKQRELLNLEHKWLLDFAESQKQYDYIKREYTKKLKDLGKPDKKRLHSVKKEYETKKKQILSK